MNMNDWNFLESGLLPKQWEQVLFAFEKFPFNLPGMYTICIGEYCDGKWYEHRGGESYWEIKEPIVAWKVCPRPEKPESVNP